MLTDHQRITIERAADRLAYLADLLGSLAAQHRDDPRRRDFCEHLDGHRAQARAGRAELLELVGDESEAAA